RRAEERFGHLVFGFVAVRESKSQIKIGEAVGENIAKRDLSLTRQIEVLALRSELADLQDAILRFCRQLERSDVELRQGQLAGNLGLAVGGREIRDGDRQSSRRLRELLLG